MREIGGYFELQHFKNHEYHEGALCFNAARYAIEYVAVTKGIRNIYLPSFLCDCVAKTLCAAGVNVITYSISKDWLPIMESHLLDDEAIVIVNYFGQLNNEIIAAMRSHYRNVIIDNIQSFFQKPVAGVSTVYSCRKYFGVPDGAYLYTDTNVEFYERLPQGYSAERFSFLAGRYEHGAQAFYSASRENENVIDHMGPNKMSVLTKNLLRAVNYEECILTRKENVDYLDDHLRQYNLIEVKNHAGLFMYPLLQSECKDLRARLIEQKIFIPKLWPALSKPASPDSKEAYLAENIIWLPIDQRYGVSDMDYMLTNIKRICGWGS